MTVPPVRALDDIRRQPSDRKPGCTALLILARHGLIASAMPTRASLPPTFESHACGAGHEESSRDHGCPAARSAVQTISPVHDTPGVRVAGGPDHRQGRHGKWWYRKVALATHRYWRPARLL